jgi:soluble lytic murein transglycosylase-like protein
LDYYQGDYTLTIAAYNAGQAAVDKYHGVPPFAETQHYVSQVSRNLKTEGATFADLAAKPRRVPTGTTDFPAH